MNKSAVPDERKTGTECCKQRWTLSVTNLRRSPVRGEKNTREISVRDKVPEGRKCPYFWKYLNSRIPLQHRQWLAT